MHATLTSYLTGYVLSLLLTCLSFALASHYGAAMLAFLAITQAAVQLRFLLHLGQEEKPQWETLTFFLMLSLLLIVVLGTLWIMHDLNMRVMSHD